MLHMFKNLIKLIAGYGSEVWDYNKTAQSETDKTFLQNARSVVKPTIRNNIIFGEWVIMPRSVQHIISSLCYINRLRNLSIP